MAEREPTGARLPDSWSREEIARAWHISPRVIDRLVREGEIGYYRAGRSRRFFAEHVAQIRSAIEVTPDAPDDDVPGLSRRSAAIRRSKLAR